jgi:hypothetical protein
LFKDTREYYETPDSEPFRSVDEILAVWEDIRPLEWRALDVGVKSVDGSNAVMDWSFVCAEPDGKTLERKGIYLVEFDPEGRKCLRFVRRVEG